MLIYCFNKYVQCQYKHEWQIKVKILHILLCFYRFCLVVFIRICVLHTALVLFGCISPDMCIAYTLVLSSFFLIFVFWDLKKKKEKTVLCLCRLRKGFWHGMERCTMEQITIESHKWQNAYYYSKYVHRCKIMYNL